MTHPTGKAYTADQIRHMDRIDQARLAVIEAESKLYAAVATGRDAGLSWRDLAPIFGTTRSAVQQRFSKPAPGALV